MVRLGLHCPDNLLPSLLWQPLYTALCTDVHLPHPSVQNCTSVKIEKFCNWNICRYLLNYPMSFFAFLHFQSIYNPITNYIKFLERSLTVLHSVTLTVGDIAVTLSVCNLYEYNLITSHKAHRVSVSLKLWVAAFISSPDFWCLLRLTADALMHEPLSGCSETFSGRI